MKKISVISAIFFLIFSVSCKKDDLAPVGTQGQGKGVSKVAPPVNNSVSGNTNLVNDQPKDY